ncbi:MAG TPA: hypothetical protein DCK99_23940 [Blastocatellia bacterium]|nr:hypothetical protein [Blastocatellia bacterium]
MTVGIRNQNLPRSSSSSALTMHTIKRAQRVNGREPGKCEARFRRVKLRADQVRKIHIWINVYVYEKRKDKHWDCVIHPSPSDPPKDGFAVENF